MGLTKRVRKPRKPRLKLIQGGNEFLARRSKAVLTLIVTSELNNQKKVG